MNRTFDINDPKSIAFFDRYRTKKGFAKALRKNFDQIVAYHATRLNHAEARSIMDDGMRRTSTPLLYQKAIDRFILSSDTHKEKREILALIDSYFDENRFITVGQLNFSIDRKLLHDECYHYLLFGSESLLPVADSLRQNLNRPFRIRLSSFGSPRIVSVEVPVNKTDDIWLETLYEYLNGEWLETSLVLHADLPKENLVGIEQVAEPFDYKGFVYN